MEMEASNRETQIYPLSKGKRFVAFLADFFLVFIISFAFFHLAVYPIVAFSSHLYEEQENIQVIQKERDSTLYGNGLLFYDDTKSDAKPTSFSRNLIYTCNLYASSIVNGNRDYDVFYRYFSSIKGDETLYEEWIKTMDANAHFFSYSPAALLPKYVEEFSPIFEEGNAPSKQGEEDFERFQKEFFLPGYSSLIRDIQENDLTYNGISYKEEQKKVDSFAKKGNTVVVSSVIGSYVLSSAIVYILVPLISKTRKTLGMIFLRRERVDSRKLMPLRRRDLPLMFFYAIFINAGLLFLVPWPIISFNELFSIPVLWELSLFSLLLDLASLIFLLFSSMDQTLVDKLTSTAMLEEEEMDMIYRTKGYGD